MAAGQALPLDMLMYYDARPCGMNGIFKHETYEPLKGYYSFVMFDNLVKLGQYAECEYKKDDIYTCAATDGKDGCIMLTYYSENDEAEMKTVDLEILANGKKNAAEIYLLDEERDLKLISRQHFTSERFELILDFNVHNSYMVKVVEE